MPKSSLQSHQLLALAIFVAPLLFAVTTAQTSKQGIAFTRFELFKNTPFQLCPTINASATPQELVPRAPRSGSRTSSHGTYYTRDNVSTLLSSAAISGETNYCSYMQGEQIIIPTKMTMFGFFPWWPVYLMRTISLGLSFVGFFYTWMSMSRPTAVRKIPLWFWIQVPIDIARVLGWWVIIIWGFADPDYFGWVTPIIWIIPQLYIWMMKGMRLRLRETGQLPETYVGLWQMPPLNGSRKYQPVTQLSEEPKSELVQSELTQPERPKSYYSTSSTTPGLEDAHYAKSIAPLGEFDNPYSSAGDDPTSSDNASKSAAKAEQQAALQEALARRRHGHSQPIIMLAMFLGLLSFVMWVMSVTHMIMGWQWPSNTHSNTLAYLQDPRTWSNPALIGNMPETCLAWLTSKGANAFVSGGFFNAVTQTYWSNLLNTAIMTIATKYAAIIHLGILINPGNASTAQRIHRHLRLNAIVITGYMAIATVGTAIYVGVERSQKKQDNFMYTNNATLTGGCSFGVVQAEKTWGYLDIAENLPLRLALASLGL